MTFTTEDNHGAVARDEWSYSTAVGVGPFRFGMTLDDVVEAAEVFGRPRVSDCAQHHRIFAPTRGVEVRRRGAIHSLPAVTAYVSQAVGLFCVAADALHGPQVMYHGIPLVRRDRAELDSDVTVYGEAQDADIRYAPSGYAGPDDPGIIVCEQGVGQVLLSRPLFVVTRDGANTEWDSIPVEEYGPEGCPTA
jgi:hypothetical protein